MAYQAAELTTFYQNANLGAAPSTATSLLLASLASQTQSGVLSDAAALSRIVDLLDGTTAVAVQSYQFFTGSTPSAAGLAYLVNLSTNANDLNDASGQYAPLSTENRYINFAINLGANTGSDGQAAFATNYGGLSFRDTVAVAYETIIGTAAATAAGIDYNAAVTYLARAENEAYLRSFVAARAPGVNVELAIRAAVIGQIMSAGATGNVGNYNAATTRLISGAMDGVLDGGITSTAGVNLLTAFSATPTSSTLNLTANQDNLVGTAGNDVFNAPLVNVASTNVLMVTLQSADFLDGGAGTDTLNASIDSTGQTPLLRNIEVVNARFTGNGLLNLAGATGVTNVNFDSSTAGFGIVTNVKGAALGVSNQNVGAAFAGSTGATTSLNLVNDGASGARITVELAGNGVASAATGLAITASNAFVNLIESQLSGTVNSLTVATSGVNPSRGWANEISVSNADVASIKSLTVSGTASVDFSSNPFSALTGVTAGDGGVKLISTNPTAGALTVTTGAGVDNLTATGGSIKSVSTGGGNDTVTTTGDAALNIAANTATSNSNTAAATLAGSVTVLGTAQTKASTAATTLATANATAASDAADIPIKAADVTVKTATLAIDTATAAQAATSKAGIDLIVATDTVDVAAKQAVVTSDTAAVNTAQTNVTKDTTAVATANTALTAANAAKAAADAVVLADTADVGTKATAKNTADTIVTATTTMTTAIAGSSLNATTQAATAAAFAAGAITDSQRNEINNAYAVGLGSVGGTAAAGQAAAAVAYANIVTANNTAATAAATALTAANTQLAADVALQTTAGNNVTAANTALTAAQTTLTADTAILTAAQTTLTADTATQTAAGNTLTADNLQVTNDTAALNAANTALTTANNKLATDTAAATAAANAKTTADNAVIAAQATVNTNATAATAAAAAATAANTAAAVAGGLSATSVTDLGAGDNSLTLSNGFAAGATITAGSGTNDTITLRGGDYLTIAGYSAKNLAKVTGFEVLGFSDALSTNAYDISAISGIAAVTLKSGVASGNTASLVNAVSGETFTLTGDLVTNNGVVAVVLAADGTADVANFVLKANYTDNNDTNVNTNARMENIDASTFETVNVNSSGAQQNPFAGTTVGYKADTVINTLNLTDNQLVTLKVTGDQALVFASTAGMTKLATVDASANTGGFTFDGTAVGPTAVAMTVTGSATAANSLTGGANADTIIGGGKGDLIQGGGGADTLTGGAGNDIFKYVAITDSQIAKRDVVTDFTANTVGLGTSGAATSAGAAGATVRTGDVIDFTTFGNVQGHNVDLNVSANAANAQTYIQNAFAGGLLGNSIHVALDSSTGILYADVNNDGNIDIAITLTGVTTLTSAAFLV